MTSGTKARNDANTKISTASAPSAPNSVSARTAARRCRRPRPAGRTRSARLVSPAALAAGVSTGLSASSMPGPKPCGSGPCTSANVLRPSLVTNLWSPVLARSTTRACGTLVRTVWKMALISAACCCTVSPAGTVSTGTSVSALLVPNVEIICCSVSYPGWPGSEKSKFSRPAAGPAAMPPPISRASQLRATRSRWRRTKRASASTGRTVAAPGDIPGSIFRFPPGLPPKMIEEASISPA